MWYLVIVFSFCGTLIGEQTKVPITDSNESEDNEFVVVAPRKRVTEERSELRSQLAEYARDILHGCNQAGLDQAELLEAKGGAQYCSSVAQTIKHICWVTEQLEDKIEQVMRGDKDGFCAHMTAQQLAHARDVMKEISETVVDQGCLPDGDIGSIKKHVSRLRLWWAKTHDAMVEVCGE